MTQKEPHKVHIPEVLPPEAEPSTASERPSTEPTSARSSVSKQVTTGLIIDILDFALFGPIGLRVGVPIGFVCGILLARYLNFGTRQGLLFAACVAIYSAFPGTRLLPLATLAGILGQLDRRKTS